MKNIANDRPRRAGSVTTFAPRSASGCAEDAERHERRLRPRCSITRNATRSDGRGDEHADRRAPTPSRGRVRLRERVDEQRRGRARDQRPRRRRRSAAPRVSTRLSRTIERGAAASTPMPIGTLTKKIHSQPSALGQDAAEQHAERRRRCRPSRPRSPSALFRSAPSWNVVVMIDSADGGEDRGAEALHRARPRSACPREVESPQSSDAAVKSGDAGR